MLRRPADLWVHFIVQHFGPGSGKAPAVHSKSTGKVRNPWSPVLFSKSYSGFECGRLLSRALFCGEGVRIEKGLLRPPGRQFALEFPPGDYAVHGGTDIHIRPLLLRKQQPVAVVVRVCKYEIPERLLHPQPSLNNFCSLHRLRRAGPSLPHNLRQRQLHLDDRVGVLTAPAVEESPLQTLALTDLGGEAGERTEAERGA